MPVITGHGEIADSTGRYQRKLISRREVSVTSGRCLLLENGGAGLLTRSRTTWIYSERLTTACPEDPASFFTVFFTLKGRKIPGDPGFSFSCRGFVQRLFSKPLGQVNRHSGLDYSRWDDANCLGLVMAISPVLRLKPMSSIAEVTMTPRENSNRKKRSGEIGDDDIDCSFESDGEDGNLIIRKTRVGTTTTTRRTIRTNATTIMLILVD